MEADEKIATTMSTDERKPTRGRLGWIIDLLAQVFSERELITPGQYCAYNAFAGTILVGAALLVGIEHGPLVIALAIGIAGLVLILAVPAAIFRPGVVPRLLFFQGFTFVLLALALTADSLRWSVLAPPRSAFRYAPGLAMALLAYGGLQVAGSPRWGTRKRRVRVVGLVAGMLCELLVVGALFFRAYRT